MAELRLIVAGLAVAACGRANGDASLPLPPGWRALPELAQAIGATAELDAVEAWGEPAMGCFAARIAAKGGGDPSAELLASLDKERVATRDVVKPDGDGMLSLAFVRTSGRDAYRGRVRARVDGGGIVALACFHNEREAVACEAACTSLLGTL
jgi:hypothetical protein